MNVYSVRLIPSLKLKFCEFLGIASTVALSQLLERVSLLERKMSQMDYRLKHPERRTIQLPLSKNFKAKVLKKQTISAPAPRIASLEGTSLRKREPAAVSQEAVRRTRRSKVISIKNLDETKPAVHAAVADSETVILINPDEATRQTVRGYFGENIEIAEVAAVEELRVRFQNQRVLAVLFDRSLLGNPVDREQLENLNRDHPSTQLIGLSSYLTLAFSESIPQSIDFVHFLTKPLTAEDLVSILDKKEQRAIS